MRAWLIAMLAACGLNAAEFFVATDGKDISAGTKAAPFATFTKAVQAAAAGDTITLRAGTYAGGQTISKAGITVQSFAGEWAALKCAHDDKSERPNNCLWITANNCAVKRLEIEGGYYYSLKFELGVTGGLAEDCKIHGSGRDVVKIAGADKITLRRCEIFDSGLRDGSNAEGIDNVNGDEMLVQDCHIHDIATCGVYPKGGSIGSIIERCFITRCGQAGISIAQSSGLQFYDKKVNPEYYSCRDCIARNNIIVDIKGSGIDLEAALRPRVYNNTLVNVAQTMRGGIRIAGNDKGGDAGLVRVKDAEIRNNIIVMSAETTRPAMFMAKDSHEGKLAMANNRYFKTGGKAKFWWEPANAYNLDLEGWKKASATDETSTEGDPTLDAAYHLKPASPCTGAGAEVKDFSDDYDGNKRGKKWDIGADQTGGEGLPTPPAKETVGTGAKAEDAAKQPSKTTGSKE